MARWLLLVTIVIAGCGGPAPLVIDGLVDLDGQPVDPLRDAPVASVLLFVSVDCPISNRYAPEIERLSREFAPQRVAWWLVYPNADDGAEAIHQHLVEYGLQLPALRDPRHAAVRAIGAAWTPEAAVVVPGKGVVYRGRIDDAYVTFGQRRAEPTRRELREALQTIVSGEIPSPQVTEVVGCHIQPLD